MNFRFYPDQGVVARAPPSRMFDKHLKNTRTKFGAFIQRVTIFLLSHRTISTSASLVRFRSTSELFPIPCSAHMSGNSSLVSKLAPVCLLGLPRFRFWSYFQNFSRDHDLPTCQATLRSCRSSLLFVSWVCPVFSLRLYFFPRLCSAVTIDNSTFGCFDIVCDQGRHLTSTLFERMVKICESA